MTGETSSSFFYFKFILFSKSENIIRLLLSSVSLQYYIQDYIESVIEKGIEEENVCKIYKCSYYSIMIYNLSNLKYVFIVGKQINVSSYIFVYNKTLSFT